jgi:hypothetical protein
MSWTTGLIWLMLRLSIYIWNCWHIFYDENLLKLIINFPVLVYSFTPVLSSLWNRHKQRNSFVYIKDTCLLHFFFCLFYRTASPSKGKRKTGLWYRSYQGKRKNKFWYCSCSWSHQVCAYTHITYSFWIVIMFDDFTNVAQRGNNNKLPMLCHMKSVR